ncbi:MAG TPA: M24 family metallopeptidase [Acidimicrobiia bacterium]|nr:M24 family metallopeptidase [Acidimicrobiia bacterium]
MTDRFAEHRRRLAEIIGPEGLAIVPAATEVVRNHDVHHFFRQDTAFWYLTGFPEPDAVAVIAPGHDDGDYTLFVRPKDPAKEVWTGVRAGVEGAKERYGADAAYELSELDSILERYLPDREVIWYAAGNERFDTKVTGLIRKARSLWERHGVTLPSTVSDISVPLGEMMLFKSPEEADLLRRAAELSARGHAEAMRFALPGMGEYAVQAALEYYWRLEGSPRTGYPSIVASGPNACILHYEENHRIIEEGDLLLIDAACEWEGYSADITRTFPVSGSFSGPQRALYEVVLAAEREGVEMAVPGTTVKAIHDEVVRLLTEGLVELGILPGPVDDALAMHHYTHFFMHGTSHWLGMDVHDRGSYRVEGKPRPLEPGMCFTVEPGLYVASDKGEIELTMLAYDIEERNQRRMRLGTKAAVALEEEEKEAAAKISHRVPEEFLGIGVRIEDDILVTSGGHENLSASVPVAVDEVEALCVEAPTLPRS